MPSYFLFQLKQVAEPIPAFRQMSATGTHSALPENERLLRVRKLRGFHRLPLLPARGKMRRKTLTLNAPVLYPCGMGRTVPVRGRSRVGGSVYRG
jgi:hypothetical protein